MMDADGSSVKTLVELPEDDGRGRAGGVEAVTAARRVGQAVRRLAQDRADPPGGTGCRSRWVGTAKRRLTHLHASLRGDRLDPLQRAVRAAWSGSSTYGYSSIVTQPS